MCIRDRVDGEVLEKNINEYNSSMYEGKEIEVYYDPDDPSDVRTDSKVFEYIFLGIGGSFAVIGAVFLIINIIIGRRIKILKKMCIRDRCVIYFVKRSRKEKISMK